MITTKIINFATLSIMFTVSLLTILRFAITLNYIIDDAITLLLF